VVDPPCVTVPEDGVAEMVKSGVAAGFTTKVTVVVWLSEPLVPVMVSVKVPVGVLELVVTLMVLVPEPPLIGFGLNEALAPEGSPLALNVTLAVKPLSGVTVTV
jgi:hypothetical protein